jgi:hypothetical protein
MATYPCQRCQRSDGLDAVVPNEVWARITDGHLVNTEVEDGRWNILCLWCIDELCLEHGIATTATLHYAGRAVCGTSQSAADAEHVSRLVDQREAALAEVDRLRSAVREHHDQRGDDRCHLDDRKLYHAVLGEGVDPYASALPPDADMLESCRRYISQRRCPGPQGVLPLPGGMTIAQLTAEVDRLRAAAPGEAGDAPWNPDRGSL